MFAEAAGKEGGYFARGFSSLPLDLKGTIASKAGVSGRVLHVTGQILGQAPMRFAQMSVLFPIQLHMASNVFRVFGLRQSTLDDMDGGFFKDVLTMTYQMGSGSAVSAVINQSINPDNLMFAGLFILAGPAISWLGQKVGSFTSRSVGSATSSASSTAMVGGVSGWATAAVMGGYRIAASTVSSIGRFLERNGVSQPLKGFWDEAVFETGVQNFILSAFTNDQNMQNVMAEFFNLKGPHQNRSNNLLIANTSSVQRFSKSWSALPAEIRNEASFAKLDAAVSRAQAHLAEGNIQAAQKVLANALKALDLGNVESAASRALMSNAGAIQLLGGAQALLDNTSLLRTQLVGLRDSLSSANEITAENHGMLEGLGIPLTSDNQRAVRAVIGQMISLIDVNPLSTFSRDNMNGLAGLAIARAAVDIDLAETRDAAQLMAHYKELLTEQDIDGKTAAQIIKASAEASAEQKAALRNSFIESALAPNYFETLRSDTGNASLRNVIAAAVLDRKPQGFKGPCSEHRRFGGVVVRDREWFKIKRLLVSRGGLEASDGANDLPCCFWRRPHDRSGSGRFGRDGFCRSRLSAGRGSFWYFDGR